MEDIKENNIKKTFSNERTLPDEDGNCPDGMRPVVFIDPETGERRIECVPEDE